MGLGALSPEAAADTIFPQSAVSGRAGFNQKVRDCIVQSAASGAPACFDSSNCAGVSRLKPALVSTAGTMALKFGAAAGPAAPFVIAAGAALMVFGIIFGHHAAAVAKERQVICAAVPAAGDSISVIDQAVQSGQITAQQGSASMDQLLSDFSAQVRSIIKNSPSQCNAACVWTKMLTAIVAQKKSVYQDLAAQQAAAQVAAQQAAAAAALAAQQAAANLNLPAPIATAVAPIASAIAPVTSAVDAAAKKLGAPAWALYGVAALVLWDLL